MSRRTRARVAAIAALLIPSAALADALVEGTWVTPDQAEMRISQCQQGFCGTLSKIVITDDQVAKYGAEAADIKIEDIKDSFNQDPKLKDRPMLGLQILTLRATTNPWHFEGEVYNPQDGNTYAGFMDVVDADTVVLKGCALYVLCQEQKWTRVLTSPTAGQ